MRALVLALVLPLSLLGAGRASAAAPEPARNAISFEPLAILSRGFLLEYERFFPDRVSVVLGPGFRLAAREDFASRTLLLHGEGRYWLVRRELISKRVGMVGPHLGFGLNFARTTVESLSLDRSLGALLTFEETFRFGYRFLVFGFQEITPSFGFNLSHQFDEEGRLAPESSLTLAANLTVGWLF